MRIQVYRDTATPKSTGSLVSIDGTRCAFGLEPPLHRTDAGPIAITPAVYEVWLRWSDKHKAWVPAVMGVQGRTDIEIHPLNLPTETEGCLGVAAERGADCILNSRPTFDLLLHRIAQCIPHEHVVIEYTGVTEFTQQPTLQSGWVAKA